MVVHCPAQVLSGQQQGTDEAGPGAHAVRHGSWVSVKVLTAAWDRRPARAECRGQGAPSSQVSCAPESPHSRSLWSRLYPQKPRPASMGTMPSVVLRPRLSSPGHGPAVRAGSHPGLSEPGVEGTALTGRSLTGAQGAGDTSQLCTRWACPSPGTLLPAHASALPPGACPRRHPALLTPGGQSSEWTLPRTSSAFAVETRQPACLPRAPASGSRKGSRVPP